MEFAVVADGIIYICGYLTPHFKNVYFRIPSEVGMKNFSDHLLKLTSYNCRDLREKPFGHPNLSTLWAVEFVHEEKLSCCPHSTVYILFHLTFCSKSNKMRCKVRIILFRSDVHITGCPEYPEFRKIIRNIRNSTMFQNKTVRNCPTFQINLALFSGLKSFIIRIIWIFLCMSDRYVSPFNYFLKRSLKQHFSFYLRYLRQ